jgi:MoaA/NifB/PqqE/SkfB family radical SAM enzyme
MIWRKWSSQAKVAMGILNGGRPLQGPYQATLLITNRCNLRCIHCGFYSPHTELPNLFELKRARSMKEEIPDLDQLKRVQTFDIDRNRALRLIDEFVELGTQNFIFTGSGEPFMHKDTLEFISSVKRSGRSCSVYTNGTLLDRGTIDELIGMGCDELRITTMAGTPEMYVRTHPGIGQEIFGNLKDNLLYLAGRKVALGKKFPKVSLFYVVIRDNHDALFDFAKFAHTIGADRVHFRPFYDHGDESMGKLVPTQRETASVRDQLVSVKSYLESEGIRHSINYSLTVFGKQDNTMEFYKVIPCYYGFLTARVGVDGLVYSCCRCFFPLGNVYEETLKDIWNGGAYQQFRNESFSINRRKVPVNGCACNSCNHLNVNLKVYRMLHPLRSLSNKF